MRHMRPSIRGGEGVVTVEAILELSNPRLKRQWSFRDESAREISLHFRGRKASTLQHGEGRQILGISLQP